MEEANQSLNTPSKTKFKWARNYCRVKQNNSVSASCECFSLGTYSITNDLYDPLVMDLYTSINNLSYNLILNLITVVTKNN